MNYNLIAYGIYFLIISLIIIKIGQVCYTNGNIYVAHLIPGDTDFCQRINSILLIGYYLFNIGYAVFVISNWETISSITQMTEAIAKHTAIIVFLLAVLHYFNLYWITKFIKTIK